MVRVQLRKRVAVYASTACLLVGLGAFERAGAADDTVNVSMAIAVVAAGTPTTVGPIAGSLTGTIDGSGNLTFPQSGIHFDALDGTIVVPVHLETQATGDWTGHLDTSTGEVTLSGPIEIVAAISSLGVTGCPLGPYTLNSSTSQSGGVAFDGATKTATVVDSTYSVPAIPDPTSGCGGQEGTINAALGLPTSPSASTTTMVLTFPGGANTTTTATVSTTTPTSTTLSTAAVTSTSVAPAAAAQLPRTGRSVLPWLIVGVVCLELGLVAVAASRRRQRESLSE